MTTLRCGSLCLLLTSVALGLGAATALADSEAPPSSTPSNTTIIVIVGIAVGLVVLFSARGLWTMARTRRWERAREEHEAAKRSSLEAEGRGEQAPGASDAG